MRIAKLELKILLAYFLAMPESDFELQDASERFPDPFPEPNRNDLQQVCARFRFIFRHRMDQLLYMQIRPIGDPCFLRFEGLQRVATSG